MTDDQKLIADDLGTLVLLSIMIFMISDRDNLKRSADCSELLNKPNQFVVSIRALSGDGENYIII